MINLRELIKFDDQLENFLSSHWKKLCNEMKDLMQKLWSSYSIRNKSKISSSEEICHVALNENEFKTMNDLFIDNNSNNSSSNNFMLVVLFMCSALSVTVLNVTVCQDKRQFKNFERECQSTNHYFINNEIFNSVYNWVNVFFKEEKSKLNESIKNTKKSESSDFNDSLKISLLLMKN